MIEFDDFRMMKNARSEKSNYFLRADNGIAYNTLSDTPVSSPQSLCRCGVCGDRIRHFGNQ